MRDEFSKHRCPGQERRRLLEAAEKDGESFIPVSGAHRESVSHCQSNGLFVLRGRVRCMCGGGLCD